MDSDTREGFISVAQTTDKLIGLNTVLCDKIEAMDREFNGKLAKVHTLFVFYGVAFVMLALLVLVNL